MDSYGDYAYLEALTRDMLNSIVDMSAAQPPEVSCKPAESDLFAPLFRDALQERITSRWSCDPMCLKSCYEPLYGSDMWKLTAFEMGQQI